MNKKIGFIGVGNMGLPMVKNLINSGFQVSVYDKDPTRMELLIQNGVKIVKKAIDVVEPGCIVITMLTNDAALLDVVLGENGIIDFLGKGETHISMSTVSPITISKAYDAHKKNGTAFIAAPVLGRPEAANSKKLYILLSGDSHAKAHVQPILDVLGQKTYDFGEEITSSSLIKLAMNFLILSAIETISESVAFVDKNNLDPKLFSTLITETLFDCAAYKYHAENIALQKFSPAGFKLSLGLKDITLLREISHSVNVPMPFANLLHDRLLSAMAKNRSHLDWSAIALNALEDSGITLMREDE